MSRYRFFALIVALKIIILGLWFSPYLTKDASHAETTADSLKQKSAVPALDLNDEKERSLISALMRRQKELDAREGEVKVKEARLLSIKNDINLRVDELNRIHDRIKELMKRIDAANDDKIKKIVKIYDLMKPEEAALRIEKLDEDTAVMVLSSLSERKAAKILGLMDVNKSVKLSEAIKIKITTGKTTR